MNQQRFHNFIENIFHDCAEIIKKKNHDYANSDNPFANFTLCEEMGLCKVEVGILMRVTDKFQRISTYINKGKLKVENESVEDACIDIINYMAILLAYLNSQKEKKNNGITIFEKLPKNIKSVVFNVERDKITLKLEPGCTYKVLGKDKYLNYYLCVNQNTKEKYWFTEELIKNYF